MCGCVFLFTFQRVSYWGTSVFTTLSTGAWQTSVWFSSPEDLLAAPPFPFPPPNQHHHLRSAALALRLPPIGWEEEKEEGGGCYHVPLLGWQHLQAQSECWARPQIQGQELPAPSFPLLHCLSQISILTPPADACESATGFCWCVLLSAGSRVQWSPGEHTATGRKYLTAGAGRTPSRLGRKPSLVGSDERIQLSDCTPAPLQPRSYWVLGLIPLLPLLSSIR